MTIPIVSVEDRIEPVTFTTLKYHISRSRSGLLRVPSMIEISTGAKSTIFQSAKQPLGQGQEGVVRLFKDDALGMGVAVKIDTPIDIKLLVEIYRRAYPEMAELFSGHYFKDTARLVMPVFKGKNLYQVLNVDKAELINNRKWALSLLLAVVREIKRLHTAGIVHGDLKTDNLMINISASEEIICSVIDLSRATLVGKEASCTPDSHGVCPHWAPERCSLPDAVKKPMTDFSQDIYSLGYLLENFFNLLNIDPKTTVLSNWIKAAKDGAPGKRPTLDSLLDFLQELERICSDTKEFLQPEKEELSNCFEIDDLESQKVEFKQLIVEKLEEEYLYFFHGKQKPVEIMQSISQRSKLEKDVKIELLREVFKKIINRPVAACMPG